MNHRLLLAVIGACVLFVVVVVLSSLRANQSKSKLEGVNLPAQGGNLPADLEFVATPDASHQ